MQDFESTLISHINSLYNLAYHMTYNEQDAKDLVQDTCVRAMRFQAQFQEGTNFKAWAMTILRNTFINDYRRKKRNPVKVNYEDIEHMVADANTEISVGEIFSEDIQKVIDQLPEDLRSMLVLYYVEQFSCKEISKVFNIPSGTVMSRLYTARQFLKKKLNSRTIN